MAIISGITIDYTSSPRLVLVDDTITGVSCQDLYDTLMYIQAQSDGIDETGIILGSGLEELGSGVKVGLTITLVDALLKFADRLTPTVCKVDGGNLVSYNSQTQEFLATPLDFSVNVMPTWTTSSSATQNDLDAIQYSSYQNGVWLDITTDNVGYEYPSGTRERPVNNFYDAVEICASKGFDTIHLLKSANAPADIVLDNLKLIGQSNTQTVVYVPSSASILQTQFIEIYLAGTLDSGAVVTDCVIGQLYYLNGLLRGCAIQTNVVLGGGVSAYLVNCGTTRVDEPPIDFDMGDIGQNLILRNFQGDCSISNLNDPNSICSLYFDAGELTIKDTVTAGTIIIRGSVKVVNEATSSAVINYEDTLTPSMIANTTWNTNLDE